MIAQTFGDMLYCPQTQSMKEFPSPEALKYRIIISTKPPKEFLESKAYKSDDRKENNSSDEEDWGKEVAYREIAENVLCISNARAILELFICINGETYLFVQNLNFHLCRRETFLSIASQ